MEEPTQVAEAARSLGAISPHGRFHVVTLHTLLRTTGWLNGLSLVCGGAMV